MPISSNLPETARTVYDADGVRVLDSGLRLDVVLCTPGNRNAQSPATWAALAGAQNFITKSTRIVVVSGEGACFSAGLDRAMLGAPTAEYPTTLPALALGGEQVLRDFIDSAQRAFSWWRTCAPITLAVVHGHAIGAGFQLALGCDLMAVLPDARLSMREPRLGLIPDLGGTHALVRAVGYSRALEICATGRDVGAAEACALGIAQFAIPADNAASALDQLVGELTIADGGVIADLKTLLRSAEEFTPVEQFHVERETQLRRIAALMKASRA